MNKSKNAEISNDYYTPEPLLIELVDELLQVHARRRVLDKKKYEGRELTGKERDDFSKLQNRTNRKMNHILHKYVFQSMANLVFLLEQMQMKPYIRKRFEEYVKVLFFTESSKCQGTPTFLRFLIACVLKYERGKARSTDEIPDFRYILAEYLQRAVMILMQEVGPHKRDLDALVINKLNTEVGSAFSWVKVFAQQPRRDLDYDRKKRPTLYKHRPASF